MNIDYIKNNAVYFWTTCHELYKGRKLCDRWFDTDTYTSNKTTITFKTMSKKICTVGSLADIVQHKLGVAYQ